MEKRNNRDHIVLATKVCPGLKAPRCLRAHCHRLQFSNDTKMGDKSIPPYAHVNYVGNGAKSLYLSVWQSLKRLRTEYIDILYVHWWGYDTSIPELMSNLHDLVTAKKVLYLGVSDTPAWIVAKANQYARDHALTPFSIYQGAWSILQRDFERDIIPMARAEGQ